MLGSLNPLHPRLTKGAIGGIFPPGATYHLPLNVNLLPLVGSGGAAAVTRAGEKRTQNGTNTFNVDATNALSITKNFLGISGATGLLPELGVTNDVTNGDDMSIAGAWAASNCTVSAKNVTDPSGAANQAQTLTPSAPGGYIENTTAVACASKNVFGAVWLRRAGGAVGSHTGQLILTDSAGTVTASKDITITSAWQCFYHEYTGTGAGAETAIIRIVPDKTGTTAVDARMPFVEVFANNSIKSLITPSLTTRAADALSQDISGNINGTIGTFYCKVTPLHSPTDGVVRSYVYVSPLLSAGTTSILYFAKTNTNNLVAGIFKGATDYPTSNYSATDLTWARGTTYKVAYRYSTAGVDLWIGGASRGSRGATQVGDVTPAATCKLFLSNQAGINQPNSIISDIRYWPKLLTDSEMARITK